MTFHAPGIDVNSDAGLRRAFDFEGSNVHQDLKKGERLKIKPDHFKVSGDGVFYTLQGEGTSMGRPACFLRLHFCNLKCSWCDSWYTWNPNTAEFWIESQDWTIQDTERKLVEAWGCDNPEITKRVVITGGEPLIQKDRIDGLMQIMPDWIFEIETNGTLMPTNRMLERCQFNCSPKLGNSANRSDWRIKADVLQALNKADTTFKFVVMTPVDVDEIEREYIGAFNLDINKILLMPQGVTAQEVAVNALAVVEVAKERGYRLLGRLQCEIWGARRGV